MQQNEKRLGPVSTADISQFQLFCEQNSIDFEVEIDEDLKAEADSLMHSHGNGEYDITTRRTANRFDFQQAKFLYVYIKNEDAPKIKDLLLTLGLSADAEQLAPQNNNSALSEKIEGEEYFCTECDYVSTVQGSCPKHGVRLLEYYQCLEARKQKSLNSGSGKIVRLAMMFVGYAIMIGVVGASLFALFKSFK